MAISKMAAVIVGHSRLAPLGIRRPFPSVHHPPDAVEKIGPIKAGRPRPTQERRTGRDGLQPLDPIAVRG